MSSAARVVFETSSSLTSSRLAVSDLPLSSAALLTPNPSPAGFAQTGEMATIGNSVLFVAGGDGFSDGNPGTQLWKTDGTAAGTNLVTALPFRVTFPPSGGSVTSGIFGLESIGTRALFLYNDGTSTAPNASQLWSTDGTATGTFRLPTGVSNSGQPIAIDGKVLLATNSGLLVTDGTVAGTSSVPVALPSGYGIGGQTPFAGGAAFVAYKVGLAPFDQQLWRTDGTTAGTHIILDVPGTATGDEVEGLKSINGRLVFTIGPSDGSASGMLWTSDGTAAGTAPLPVSSVNANEPPVVAGGRYYVATAAGLEVTDGTAAGSSTVFPNASNGPSLALNGSLSAEHVLAALGNRLLFGVSTLPNGGFPSAHGQLNPMQLWVTDGTTGGTALVTTLPDNTQPSTIAGSSDNSGIGEIASVGNEVVFNFNDGNGQTGIWVSDGTANGTHAILSGTSANLSAGAYATVFPSSGPPITWTDTTSGNIGSDAGQVYSGPVSYLQAQYSWSGRDSVNLRAAVANVFLRGGTGDDALAASGGSNVLDGGTGSNFLVGASGADGGTDTFFTDARSKDVIWNTLVNFHAGDSVTLWGFDPSVSTWHWDGVSGAGGYTGATLRADMHGTGTTDASITFAGLTTAQAQGLQVSTGTVGSLSYLYFHSPGA